MLAFPNSGYSDRSMAKTNITSPNMTNHFKIPNKFDARISYQRCTKRAPQLGQASALLETWCPQSLHSVSLDILFLHAPIALGQ
jgi:hypothetical protein